MSRIAAVSLALALIAAPCAALAQEKPGYPGRYARTPKYDALSPGGKLWAQAGAVALSFVTVPLRIATTVLLTPPYPILKTSRSKEGQSEAEAFANKYLHGEYAVRPEHVSGDVKYRFFGIGTE